MIAPRALLLGAAALALLASAHPAPPPVNDAAILDPGFPAQLSTFGFFAGPGASAPNPALVGYHLNTPLFSDYAEKRRMIYLPAGQRAAFDGPGNLLALPVGSAIIKTFGYGEGDAFRAIETRVLLHRADGWLALPYVWSADGSDAMLALAGARLPVTLTRPSGETVTISYAVPNKNQCKECHATDGKVTPIGPVAGNMVVDEHRRAGFAARLSGGEGARAYPVWDRPETGSLDARARAYLAVNCAHCHKPDGSASNSGLFLRWQDEPGVALGLYKRPVAAGRGSGGRDFAIHPGHSDASIMPYRMGSTDPGIAMPEVGRALVHDEGVALIRAWIDAMPAEAPSASTPAD